MNAPAGTLELSLERSGGYTQTVTLIGQVIAMHGTRIARELARPRPDRAAIAALESGRHVAVALCRTLNSADTATLEEIRDTYARMYLDLLAASSPAAGRGTREPFGA
ncbi:hypothetical protein [Sporichthya sp.]|uniref:hypothetical protein n=1 Tax=Sporichthya sp. TaxID=65475 RepID=UPI0017E8DD0B|nr:hypothetical protein [Sporichthya sp.]MBA3744756.1 hypothetical protein [Sporichthya sp.]